MELYLNVTVFFFSLKYRVASFSLPLSVGLFVHLFGVYAPHLHCVHVYLYTCVCAGMHICDQDCEGQKLMSDVFLNLSPPCFLPKPGAHLFSLTVWSVSSRDPILCPQQIAATLGFCMDAHILMFAWQTLYPSSLVFLTAQCFTEKPFCPCRVLLDLLICKHARQRC